MKLLKQFENTDELGIIEEQLGVKPPEEIKSPERQQEQEAPKEEAKTPAGDGEEEEEQFMEEEKEYTNELRGMLTRLK